MLSRNGMTKLRLVGQSPRMGTATSLCVIALVASGCGVQPGGSEADAPGMRAATTDELGRSVLAPCTNVTQDTGVANAFMPEATASSGPVTIQFRGTPSGTDANGNPLVDAVIGLSDGPAGDVSALGPTVRFNSFGYLDARNGDSYQGGFPYRTGVGSFEFKLDIDVSAHSYSAWARHLDSPNKPFELLGEALAFPAGQAGVTRLDNVAVFVNGAAPEAVSAACGFSYSSATSCVTSDAGSPWRSQAFTAQSGTFRVELTATPVADGLDAVVGLAQDGPTAFSDLAAIVRFRPDGTFDARNGATYAAETTVPYHAGSRYWIAFDVDTTNGTYSAQVAGPGDEYAPFVLAHDYAFRTEQASTSWFDHLGLFVDGESGSATACQLTVVQ